VHYCYDKTVAVATSIYRQNSRSIIDQDGAINRLLADLNEHIATTPTIFTTNALTHLTVLRLYKLLGDLDANGAANLTVASRQAICDIVAGDTVAGIPKGQLGLRTAETAAVLRGVAIHALGVMGGNDAVNALKKRARMTTAARIRRLALSALANIDPAAADRLRDELLEAEISAASGALGPHHKVPRKSSYGAWKNIGIAISICITAAALYAAYFPAWILLAFIALPTITIILFNLYYRVSPLVERVHARAIDVLNCDDPNVLNELNFGTGSHSIVPFSVQIGEALSNISADNAPFLLPDYLRRINGILRMCTQPLRRQFTTKSAEYLAINESRDLQSSYRRGLLTVARAEVVDGLVWIGDSKTAQILREMAKVTTDADFREHCVQAAEAIGVRLASPPGELLRPVRADPAGRANQLVKPSNAPGNDIVTKQNDDHQNEAQAFHQHVAASSPDEVQYD
jgi:hypothetical protein